MNSISICTFNKLSWVIPKRLLHILPCLPLRVHMKKPPTIPTNFIHTCHVGFHVHFSSIENVMGYNKKKNYPPVNLKQGSMALSTNENSRILKSLIELFVKSLEEGWNHEFDLSLRKLSIKSSLPHHTLEPISKVGCKFWDLLLCMVLYSLTPKSHGVFSLNQRCTIKYKLETLFVLAYKRNFREWMINHIYVIGIWSFYPWSSPNHFTNNFFK